MEVNSVNNYNFNNNIKITPKHAINQNETINSNNIKQNNISSISYRGFFSDLFTDKFKNPEQKAMYNELTTVLSGKDKINLEILYNTGRLLNTNSNDKSSTLENLYKIYKNPRVEGLDNKQILIETIERLANPFVINQKFGQIPNKIANDVLSKQNSTKSSNEPNTPKTVADMNVQYSASCVAASIEFSLADRKPAEFARFIEGLTSPNMAVVQNVKYSNLNKDFMTALNILNLFNTKPENPSSESVDIKIAPDKDAIIRAKLQKEQYNGMNRSSVDVLMQSAFMQLGSQNTYNSLTDKRYGALNTNDTGLTEQEKTFVETIVGNDGEKTSVIYQKVNDNTLEGYEYSPEETEKHILNTLAQGKNVIIGVTELDGNKKIIGGHEMTIIGYKKHGNDIYFVCNDTDDNYVGALEVKAKDLIPSIHHAGIPAELIAQENEPDRGKELLKQFNDARKAA